LKKNARFKPSPAPATKGPRTDGADHSLMARGPWYACSCGQVYLSAPHYNDAQHVHARHVQLVKEYRSGALVDDVREERI
jgi:hypothetical protein